MKIPLLAGQQPPELCSKYFLYRISQIFVDIFAKKHERLVGEALKEVDLSLELKPDLALAYARRGSIYYKLGDVQRATINWNLALRLDPEYDDVRNILKALNENRLKEVNLFEE